MSDYVIDPAWGRERERLAMLEEWTDPMTRRRLAATGLEEGWHCLEVGAGSGSVASWLAQRTGPSGRVVAVDVDTRFLDALDAPSVEVVPADVLHDDLPEGPFDLIHGRAIIHHLDEPRRALDRLAGVLKPGGVLLIEEPDCLAGVASTNALWRRVWEVLRDLPGLDLAYGRHVLDDLRAIGMRDVDGEAEVHLVRGGSRLAQWHCLTAGAMRGPVLAAGLSEEDLETLLAQLRDPDVLELGFTWMAGWGRRPA